ncbi:hypothetical protein PV04_05958 [Phialophora macrospora]|uniref:Uncharacterized protein n=1 Tax=Phialophora macrospora TaxID=1851006 RepID=A0A0D2DX12_9EURO|nr:hypothetical protein PV04_05958 [Phialophora macrospora]
MPSKYAEEAQYGESRRRAQVQKTQPRKYVDADGNKYLVRKVIREEVYEPVREQPRSRKTNQPASQRDVRYQPQYEARQGSHQEERYRSRSHPSHGSARTPHPQGSAVPVKSGRQPRSNEAGTGRQYNVDAQSQPQRRQTAPGPLQEDPRRAAERARRQAERARREAKKAKYLKWLLFFVS